MRCHRPVLGLSTCTHHALHRQHSLLPCSSPSTASHVPHRRYLSSLPSIPSLFSSPSSFPLRWGRPGRTTVHLPLPSLTVPHRHIQSHVDELRSGNLFEHDSKVYRVVSHEAHMRGRAHTTILLECRDEAGNKVSLRLRPADKVELVQLDTEELTFLYRDDTTLHLMHPATFDSIELPVSTLATEQLPFLTDNTSVKCTKRGNEYLGITLPEKAVCTVAKAEGHKGGGRGLNDSKGRVVVLENGVEVSDCPNSVEVGDRIVVNTQTLRFMQKEE